MPTTAKLHSPKRNGPISPLRMSLPVQIPRRRRQTAGAFRIETLSPMLSCYPQALHAPPCHTQPTAAFIPTVGLPPL